MLHRVDLSEIVPAIVFTGTLSQIQGEYTKTGAEN